MKGCLCAVWLFVSMNAGWAQSPPTVPDKDTLVRYFENQNYAGAAGYLEPIAAAYPDNLHDLSLLGYAYYMSNQLSRAEKCYSRVWRSDSGNITACNYLGKINLLKGDKVQALHFFCRLAALKPGIAGYYKQLAALWEQRDNPVAAAYYYRLAYKANPHDPAVVSSLAGHWITQKMYGPADSILDAALREDSMQAAVIETKIRSAYLQKDYPAIFPLVNRLKQMGDIMLTPFLYAAIGYYSIQQYQKCTETCDFMIMHQLKTRTVLYLEALAYKKLKKYKLSLAMLDECIGLALDRDADDYFAAKAGIYETLHQYHTAIRQYDTAYYIFQDPLQLYNKGRIYDAYLKSPKTALRYYNRYLRHRRKPLPPEEKPVLKYVLDRVKTLQDWEKQQQ